MRAKWLSRRWLPLGIIVLTSSAAAPAARATTYFPIADDELIRRTPVVVHARAVGRNTIASRDFLVETVTEFEVLELVRGQASKRVQVAVPGGELPSGQGARFDGVPGFVEGREYLLFLHARNDGRYGVSELALGSFDVLADRAGTRFAARAPFLSGEIEPLRGEDPALAAERVRELKAFERYIRSWGREAGSSARDTREDGMAIEPRQPDYFTEPVGTLGTGGREALWSEARDQQDNTPVRWFTFAAATVGYVDDNTGTTTNPANGVPGGGVTEFNNSIAAWNNDAASTVAMSNVGSTTIPPPAVTVHFDNVAIFGNVGMACGFQGQTGLGGNGYAIVPVPFKGDNYYAAVNGSVYMRRWDCVSESYLASAFQNTLTHELGHVLGFNHPDQATSPHDFTPTNYGDAVMISVSDYNRPVGFGIDDREGLCWLYGLCQLSGDVNGDGSRGVPDVLYMINDLFAGGPDPLYKGDVNNSGRYDVSDIGYMINYLFAGGPAPL